MLLLLTALPVLLGLSFVFDVWDDDEDDPIKVTDERPYFGGDSADQIEGNSDDNLILAGGGDDNVSGGAGDDLIAGQAGNDEIEGNDGNDFLVGNGGDDILNGGAGDDDIEGGHGDDTIFLGDGDDESGTYFGANEDPNVASSYLQQGDDTIYGGAGNDFVRDGNGSNTLYGEAGNDTIYALDYGDTDTDVVDGGAGADTIYVDDGDTVTGGADADLIGVVRTDTAENSVVTVTDFDPAEDVLVVDWQGESRDDNIVEFRDDADGVTVTFDGVEMVFLADVTGAQLSDDSVRFV